ncbi:hypothetical protein KC842_00890 [Candidatus Nomurabacteria bacterium]|nr:hypothetical protein [Candidatus Nomurabacteria bacterium]USN95037.1 MAG: hypothetical protein H6791_01235 [Candidatus Nomurabacteria bacterium]
MSKIRVISTAFFAIFALFLFQVRTADALTLSPVRIEVSADPGETVNTELKLYNDQTVTKTFYVSFENFEALGESGTPSFTSGGEGLATWIYTTQEVILNPNESKTVPVTIAVPESADPGGYFAAIFWSNEPPSTGTGQVSIGAKVGTLVLLRVNGEIDEAGGIVEFSSTDGKKFFTSLPVDMFYRFQNGGNDRIKPEGDVTIKHMFGFTKAIIPANIVDGNVLPSQIRKFEVSWQSKNGLSTETENMNFWQNVKNQWRNFAFGYYNAKLSLTYGGDNSLESNAKFGFWIIPWQLLIVVIVSLFILSFLYKRLTRRHKDMLIKEMKEEIRKEIEEESHHQGPEGENQAG